MRKAASVFGALRKCLLGSKHTWKSVKAEVMTAMILPTMLDGVECCVITARLLREMTSQYHQWIRSCCRITPYTQRKRKITSEELIRKMGLQPLHYYIDLKQLAYAGHVQRMDYSRLPKLMSEASLPGPRKPGRPHKNMKACITEGLTRKGANTTNWKSIASNKTAWAKVIRKKICVKARWQANISPIITENDWAKTPSSLIGEYVESKFCHKWYTGEITDVDVDVDTNQTLWHVIYDDGDEADYDERQLCKILCLDMRRLIENE